MCSQCTRGASSGAVAASSFDWMALLVAKQIVSIVVYLAACCKSLNWREERGGAMTHGRVAAICEVLGADCSGALGLGIVSVIIL